MPILAVTDEAKRFADSNTPSDKLSAINKNDEIGVLAKAVGKMETDIVEYVENLTMVTAEKERIGAELSIATQIQADMLPRIFPAFPDKPEFDIYATMNPAKEVGGDFYDYFMVDESHLAIVMADVSGKGVPAALFMVIGKTLIKDHTQPGRDLGEVFTEVNDLLCESNSEGLFITAFEGVLDLVSGEFTFVNAGHEIPFICKKDGSYEPYKIRAGFVLAGMEGIRYKCGTMQLSPGDRLFQYTDAVTEAMDQDGNLYGMERLREILAQNTALAPMKLLGKIKEDIDAFVGDAPQFDDITYNPKTGPATVRIDVLQDPLSVVVTFIDNGKAYDPLAREDPDISLTAQEREIGGLGIYMVKKSMDEISYQYKDGQNILRIKKKI